MGMMQAIHRHHKREFNPDRKDPHYGVGDFDMLHKLVGVAAWALLSFIVFATISPIQARPALPTSSAVEHLAAFSILGVLFCLAYPRKIGRVCLLVLGSAVLLEFAQLLTPDRHGRIVDAIEKMAGGAIGVVAGSAILYF